MGLRRFCCGWDDDFGGLRLVGLLVAMFIMVDDTSFGNVFWMVWERVEIRCSTLSNCWVWCWWMIEVR